MAEDRGSLAPSPQPQQRLTLCRMAYCSEREEPACQFPQHCLLNRSANDELKRLDVERSKRELYRALIEWKDAGGHILDVAEAIERLVEVVSYQAMTNDARNA